MSDGDKFYEEKKQGKWEGWVKRVWKAGRCVFKQCGPKMPHKNDI